MFNEDYISIIYAHINNIFGAIALHTLYIKPLKLKRDKDIVLAAILNTYQRRDNNV